VQDKFDVPTHRAVVEMLREKISQCDALIHLVGVKYGFEPQKRELGEPSRSYTQLEYDIACEFQKARPDDFKLYVFVCAETFPYDLPRPKTDEFSGDEDPESPAKKALQLEHRRQLFKSDALYAPVKSQEELEKRVRELSHEIESLRRTVVGVGEGLGRIESQLDRLTTAITTGGPSETATPPTSRPETKGPAPVASNVKRSAPPPRVRMLVVPGGYSSVSHLAEFEIAISPVTNKQFAKFIEAASGTAPSSDGETLAKAQVDAARSFCDWLTYELRDGFRYRIPTAAEWHRAFSENIISPVGCEWVTERGNPETRGGDSSEEIAAFRYVREAL
jgi:hypothetical protein